MGGNTNPQSLWEDGVRSEMTGLDIQPLRAAVGAAMVKKGRETVKK
jgi:hypothetical protein